MSGCFLRLSGSTIEARCAIFLRSYRISIQGKQQCRTCSVRKGFRWNISAISTTISVCRQQEEQRSMAAREAWGRRHTWARGQLESSIWLEAVGARALSSEENSRFACNLALPSFSFVARSMRHPVRHGV